MDLSKDVLTVNYDYLVKHVKADALVPKLVSAFLVGREMNQEIENQTNAKKVQTLLESGPRVVRLVHNSPLKHR